MFGLPVETLLLLAGKIPVGINPMRVTRRDIELPGPVGGWQMGLSMCRWPSRLIRRQLELFTWAALGGR